MQTVQSQDTKITKITEVLKLIYDIQEPRGTYLEGLIQPIRRASNGDAYVTRTVSSLIHHPPLLDDATQNN